MFQFELTVLRSLYYASLVPSTWRARELRRTAQSQLDVSLCLLLCSATTGV